MVLPTRSQTGTGEYDPWVDLNDDGAIDIYDAITLANHFGTTGTPINKTDLLLQLLNRLDQLNTTVIEQQNTINNLNQTVVYLNETVAILDSTGLGAPDYDSGWQSMPVGSLIILTHNLNTTELLVYFIGKYDSDSIWMHQYCFGGDSKYLIGEYGAWWAATNTTINLYRAGSDHQSGMPWGLARVMIWKIPQP